jgi:hypothetical protein
MTETQMTETQVWRGAGTRLAGLRVSPSRPPARPAGGLWAWLHAPGLLEGAVGVAAAAEDDSRRLRARRMEAARR